MINAVSYTITNLGGLPGFGTSRALALNDAGQIVGTLQSEADHAGLSDLDFYGFLWQESEMESLGKCLPKSISCRGQIVGAICQNIHKSPQISAAVGHNGRLKLVQPQSGVLSMANAVNENGQFVGFQQPDSSKAACETKRIPVFWDSAGLRPLVLPEGCRGGSAVSLNDHGHCVGEVWNDTCADNHAALWQGNEVTLLEKPPGFNQSAAIAINNAGSILFQVIQSNLAKITQEMLESGNSDAHVLDTFIYQQTSFLSLRGPEPSLARIDGMALALNDLNQVVGWAGLGPGQKASAFLWQEGRSIDLNTLISRESDWHLSRANAINNKGQIVGYGTHHGQTRAFLLTLIL